MAVLKDFKYNGVPDQETKYITVIGNKIVARRGEEVAQLNVKAYGEQGDLIADLEMQSGEKITTSAQYKRLEVTNDSGAARDIIITAGFGDFDSDIVEGNVNIVDSVKTRPVDKSTTFGNRAFNDLINDIEMPPESYNVGIYNDTDVILYIGQVGEEYMRLDIGQFYSFDIKAGDKLNTHKGVPQPTTGFLRYAISYYAE